MSLRRRCPTKRRGPEAALMLSWLLRPIEPSRFAFLVPPLLALIALAYCGAMAIFGPTEPPSGFHGSMWLALGGVAWLCAAVLLVRRRREGRRGFGFLVVGELIAGASLMLMQAPSLVWPSSSFEEPIPLGLVITHQACWWAIGLLWTVFTYRLFSQRRQPVRGAPSFPEPASEAQGVRRA